MDKGKFSIVTPGEVFACGKFSEGFDVGSNEVGVEGGEGDGAEKGEDKMFRF